MFKETKIDISKEQQIKELIDRVPPILNVDIIIVNEKREYLIGRRAQEPDKGEWSFPGGRMLYTEKPQETAERILRTETKGIKAIVRKLITATSTMGDDIRANGVTLFYLLELKSGNPNPNEKLDSFKWVNKEQLLKEERASWLSKTIVDEIDSAIRTMNTTEDEILVEVNKENEEIGTIIKREAHNTNKRYHRAAHIMIFDSIGNVVLQQRSWSKTSSPGKWDMPGGHQAAGQTIEQCAQAELSEEMGIQCELNLRKIGLNTRKKQAEFYYLYFGISDGPYGFDRNEVEAIKTFNCQELLDGKYDKEYDILQHVKDYTEELKDVWAPLKAN